MKKILLIFIITINIYANDELKIYERILPAIFKVEKIDVYVSKDMQYKIEMSNHFKVVKNCEDALILIGSNFKNLKQECLKKPLFATNYITYKTYKNSFGAFYWRKARPQLKFKLEVLKRFNLLLPKTLKKYAR